MTAVASMELAEKIVAAAQRALEEDRARHSLDVTISLIYGKHKYSFSLFPEPDHMVIRFDSLDARVLRSDKDAFEEILLKTVIGEVESDLVRDYHYNCDAIVPERPVAPDESRYKLTCARRGTTIHEVGTDSYDRFKAAFTRHLPLFRHLK